MNNTDNFAEMMAHMMRQTMEMNNKARATAEHAIKTARDLVEMFASDTADADENLHAQYSAQLEENLARLHKRTSGIVDLIRGFDVIFVRSSSVVDDTGLTSADVTAWAQERCGNYWYADPISKMIGFSDNDVAPDFIAKFGGTIN